MPEDLPTTEKSPAKLPRKLKTSLLIDRGIHKKMKRAARAEHRTLSGLVESLIEARFAIQAEPAEVAK